MLDLNIPCPFEAHDIRAILHERKVECHRQMHRLEANPESYVDGTPDAKLYELLMGCFFMLSAQIQEITRCEAAKPRAG